MKTIYQSTFGKPFVKTECKTMGQAIEAVKYLGLKDIYIVEIDEKGNITDQFTNINFAQKS